MAGREKPAQRWQQLRRDVQARWDRLTDADIDAVQGNTERLIEALQARYGYQRDAALREIRRWSYSLRAAS